MNRSNQLNLAEAPRIDLRDAKAEFDRGAALFVDVRSIDEYEQSHIVGAISIPLKEVVSRAGQLPRDRLIIFY